MKAYENLIEPLLSYTCDVFSDMTQEKFSLVKLTYEIMRQAIVDLYSDNENLSLDAKNYFKSSVFKKHCENVGICEDIMLRIVNNPHKYLKEMGVYGEEKKSAVTITQQGSYNESFK